MGVQVTISASQIDKERLGYQAISLTHYSDTAEPSIAAGSKVEVGGALYEFTIDEAGTGWAGVAISTQAYMSLVPLGASISWVYTSVAPTWDTAKQGWYTGANRIFAKVYKDTAGTGYLGKLLLSSGMEALKSGSGLDYRLGRLWHLPLDNTTSRNVCTIDPPAAGVWTAAKTAAGSYGVPTAAIAIRAKVQLFAYATAAGVFILSGGLSNNNSNVPLIGTAHPFAISSGYASAAANIIYTIQECDIPLNSSGQFYWYTSVASNVTVASSQLSVNVVGYYMGD
jgi:hypothetical protein